MDWAPSATPNFGVAVFCSSSGCWDMGSAFLADKMVSFVIHGIESSCTITLQWMFWFLKKAGKFKFLGNALLAGKVVIFLSNGMKISGTDADTKYIKGLARFARSAWIKNKTEKWFSLWPRVEAIHFQVYPRLLESFFQVFWRSVFQGFLQKFHTNKNKSKNKNKVISKTPIHYATRGQQNWLTLNRVIKHRGRALKRKPKQLAIYSFQLSFPTLPVLTTHLHIFLSCYSKKLY